MRNRFGILVIVTLAVLVFAAAPAAGQGRLVAAIEVGGSPSSIVATPEAVWVSLGLDGIARIDPRTNAVVARIRPGGAVIGLALGYGALWAVDVFGDRLLRIDPATNTVTREQKVGGLPNAVTVGHGSVWVQNLLDGTVQRLDPGTGEVEATVYFEPGSLWVGGLRSSPRGVWVITGGGNEVSLIEPGRTTVVLGIPVQGARTLAVAGSTLWVGRANARDLVRVGPRRISYIDLPGLRSNGYGPALAGGTRVWVVAAGHVAQLDGTSPFARLPLRHHVSAIVVVAGDLWLTDQTDGRLLRLQGRP